jgi:hypothetical protein
MRVGLYPPVNVKTLRSQKLRVLLTHRKLLQSKGIAIENDLRATLRSSEGGHDRDGQVRGAYQGACREPSRFGRLGRAVACCPARCFVNRSVSCIADCWSSSGTMKRAGPDDLRCLSRGSADLTRHGRCAGPLQELQGSQGGVWIDTCHVSVGRERPYRHDIRARGRDDADDALRGGPEHAGAFDETVLAQAWAMKIARQAG